MTDNPITTPTRFVDVNGTRFAWRTAPRRGRACSVPEVCVQQRLVNVRCNDPPPDRRKPRTSASSMLACAVEEAPLSESMLEATLEHRFAARIEVPPFFPVSMMLDL
ncbi:hypothetical protein [Burkholderia sp. LMG 21824]|uniref:hypothetical protein n=1 Tax=Burkholderia sp. LMG 21824 TaxID=3158172 RepID=UPI003C2EA89E